MNHRTILHKKRTRIQILILLFQYISSHVSTLNSVHVLLYTWYLLTIALPVNYLVINNRSFNVKIYTTTRVLVFQCLRRDLTALLTNMRTLKFKSLLHNCVFRCRHWIIITITSNEPWNTETHKTDRNRTNHKSHTMTVSCLLNFRIRNFLKSAVKGPLAAFTANCRLQISHAISIKRLI